MDGKLRLFIFFAASVLVLVIIQKRLGTMTKPAAQAADKPVRVRLEQKARSPKPLSANQNNAKPLPYGFVQARLSIAARKTLKHIKDRDLT